MFIDDNTVPVLSYLH